MDENEEIFSSLLKSNGCLSWLRNINFGRVREVLDLLELGKNVSNLMQRLSSENVSIQQNSGETSQNDPLATLSAQPTHGLTVLVSV